MMMISPEPLTMASRGKHGQSQMNHQDQLDPTRSRRGASGLGLIHWIAPKIWTSSTVNSEIELHQHYRQKRGCNQILFASRQADGMDTESILQKQRGHKSICKKA
eukprot:scaffold57247_cov37-Cyclotella_meneghiniana.AAC.2